METMKENNTGWRKAKISNSLPEVFSSINVPRVEVSGGN